MQNKIKSDYLVIKNAFFLYKGWESSITKGPFSNVVLITLFIFLKICISEKVCKNIYNVI